MKRILQFSTRCVIGFDKENWHFIGQVHVFECFLFYKLLFRSLFKVEFFLLSRQVGAGKQLRVIVGGGRIFDFRVVSFRFACVLRRCRELQINVNFSNSVSKFEK